MWLIVSSLSWHKLHLQFSCIIFFRFNILGPYGIAFVFLLLLLLFNFRFYFQFLTILHRVLTQDLRREEVVVICILCIYVFCCFFFFLVIFFIQVDCTLRRRRAVLQNQRYIKFFCCCWLYLCLVFCLGLGDLFVSQNTREFYLQDGFWFMYVSFRSMVKFQFHSEFQWITFLTSSCFVV